MIEKEFVKHLIKRLARVDANEGWNSDLKPGQRTALEYLARANRFSRKPSQIADFLGSTRGTVSQTLKALAEKGLVVEIRSETDKRSISYDVTTEGFQQLATSDKLTGALDGVHREALLAVAVTLRTVLDRALVNNGQRDFGLCRRCKHFVKQSEGGTCELLAVDLTLHETTQICYHSEPRAIDKNTPLSDSERHL